MDITPAAALALRMRSLLLHQADHSGRASDVAGVVTWLGAMQAQDLNSGLWSFGVRLGWSTADDVQAALERREALRTWPMRGTVHFVPSRDAHWMLDLTGRRALVGATARRAYLGLTEEVANRAVDMLGAALAGGNRLTRAQCLQVLADAGIDASTQLGYHLLWYTSQRGVTCIAPNIGTEQTFVLLDEWVPDPVRLSHEEALATLAIRYFGGRGPSTRQDFAGWTGLPAAEAKRGIAAAGEALATVRVDGQEMLLHPALLDAAPATAPDEVLALPGFDEYLLGFKDRSLMLAAEHKNAIIPGGNGVFQATIVRAGRVIGTWKRSLTPKRVDVSVRPLVRLGVKDRARVEKALAPYARFHARDLRVTWP
jgi:winged helix DNA-binding protein